MDPLLKKALPRLALSIVSKTILFSFIGLYSMRHKGDPDKLPGIVFIVFLMVCFFDLCLVLIPNYQKHLELERVLGKAYEDELNAKIEEVGITRLFSSYWFITRWKEYESKKWEDLEKNFK